MPMEGPYPQELGRPTPRGVFEGRQGPKVGFQNKDLVGREIHQSERRFSFLQIVAERLFGPQQI